MKNFSPAVVCGLLVIFTVRCPAQDLKTIAACRAYREAWLMSIGDDTKRLSVRELLHRAEQIVTCSKEIDINPIKSDMTHEEAENTSINEAGYPLLSSAYYQEAFSRAAWFIESKHLTSKFISSDENGKRVKPSPDKSK